MKPNMFDFKDDERFHERILISVALILSAGLICYNLFYIPEACSPTIVYVDEKSRSSQEDYEEESSTESLCVNINTAGQQELADGLPGVGKVTAQRIIDFRDSNGPFKSIDEIMSVKGIGEKSFEKIKDLICV